jgi:beta-glucosidase-like glycosyl hydrolase
VKKILKRAFMFFLSFHFLEAQSSLELLQRKAGELLWVGFHSLDQIKNLQPSGVVFFGWNTIDSSQLKKNIQSLKKLESEKGLRILSAIDHEGGRVQRLKKGLSFIPDAAALAASKDTELAENISFLMSRELYDLGVDINFAPVMDRGNSLNFLANRLWGEDSESITQMTQAFIEGHLRGGTLPFPKHFPGHGMMAFQDAHFLPIKNPESKKSLIDKDLLPFKKVMSDSRLAGMMSAHVEISSLDPKPASLSKKVMTEFLREELGYQGFILSDDLEMTAAREGNKNLSELVIESLQAGVDAVLIVWSQKEQLLARDRIVKAIQSGELSEKEIDLKISRLKILQRKIYETQNKSLKIPSLSSHEKEELLDQAWTASQEWIIGNQKTFQQWSTPLQKTSWHVISPPGAYAKIWKTFRPQDIVQVHNHLKAANQKQLNKLEKKLSQSTPLVFLTPPLHEDGGQWARGITKLLNFAYSNPHSTAPLLWIHMGSNPVKVTQTEKLSKAMSLVLLHSDTTVSLRHFMTMLSSGYQPWKSVSQRSSSLLPSPSW